MTKSGFYDVDQNDPARLVAALDRRSSARLYELYRAAIVRAVETTTGPVLDVGAGAGHLVDRLSALSDGRLVLGIEPSSALVEAARSAGRPVIRSTGAALPFRQASVGCVIAERVLQHVDDVAAVLAEMDRVLKAGGLLLAADPDHQMVRLAVPHLQDLADRLVRWRARSGTACPEAVAVSCTWLRDRGYSVTQETFRCATANFSDARVITNFPEWAQLAREAGEDVSPDEAADWEEHWRQQASAEADQSAWFYWPVVITAASRPSV